MRHSPFYDITLREPHQRGISGKKRAETVGLISSWKLFGATSVPQAIIMTAVNQSQKRSATFLPRAPYAQPTISQ